MNKQILIAPRAKCKIELYPDGVRLNCPKIGNPTGKGGGPRGVIEGWSKASRKRMREFLLLNTLPNEYVMAGCTYTIPGYNIPLIQTRKLWHNFQVYVSRYEISMVWRVEVQKRGQLHWHVICGRKGESEESYKLFKDIWHKALNSIGPITYTQVGHATEPIDVGFPVGQRLLMDWPGAEKYSARVDPYIHNSAAFKRYLNDHATKSKQEQVGENIGRHWGVIGRKSFVKVSPIKSEEFDWKTYSKIIRQYNRLCTPYVKRDGALFGRVRGYSCKRGKIGTSTYFASPETMRRLIDWAKRESGIDPQEQKLRKFKYSSKKQEDFDFEEL